jgi:glycosyltransferase involved in cell wall biosynthesis
MTPAVIKRKLISVVTPCYNEQGNVEELHRRIAAVFETLPQYDWEHIYIDNASRDDTPKLLRAMAATDPRVKVILNNRNFGHIRSPFHALLQAQGDAVVSLAGAAHAIHREMGAGVQGGARPEDHER